jgi:gas vesicle protein
MKSRQRSEGGEGSAFLLFLAGAAVGAVVALLTARESGEESRHHIDGWLKDHGVDGGALLNKVKNLLHVRKNGHVVNGLKQGGRRHG